MLSDNSRPGLDEQDFLNALNAWRHELEATDLHSFWRGSWLGPECVVLRYAAQTQCQLSDKALAALDETLAGADDLQQARASLHLPGAAPEHCRQAAKLAQGLLHGVRAAVALRNWSPEHGLLPADDQDNGAALKHLDGCVRAYHGAWPLTSEVAPTGSKNPFLAHLGGHGNRWAKALDLLANDSRFQNDRSALDIHTWLVIRRLLNYLLPAERSKADTSTKSFDTQTRILLFNDVHGGVVGPLNIHSEHEGQFGCYLDPVALGQTCVDSDLLDSLRLGWRAAKPRLQGRFGAVSEILPAVRLSPDLPNVELIGGGSAGGLFACGVYAAAMGIPLNSNCSASAALFLEGDDPDPTSDINFIEQLKLTPVTKDSVGPKILAAGQAEPPIQHVALEAGQATKEAEKAGAQKENLVLHGVNIHPVSSLDKLFEVLTGDARIEQVLKDYSDECVEKWESAWTNPKDAHRLLYYVPARFALRRKSPMNHDIDVKFKTRGAKSEQPAKAKRPFMRVPGGTEEEIFANLLSKGGDRLCVSEGPGAGKSIFTRRLQAYLSSQAGRNALFSRKPCLAVRWEAWSDDRAWPNDFELSLASKVDRFCNRPGRARSAKEVVDFVLREGRAVLILDSIDQASDEHIRSFQDFLAIAEERKWRCRIILTGRPSAVGDQMESLLTEARWRFAKIKGFDAEQQYRYLYGPTQRPGATDAWSKRNLQGRKIKRVLKQTVDESQLPADREERLEVFRELLRQAFANYDAVSELFANPAVLDMVRRLKRAGQLREFNNRGDLYYQTSDFMLERGMRKILQRTPSDDETARMEEILAAVAFSMMCRKGSNYRIDGKDNVRRVKKATNLRLAEPVSAAEWKNVKLMTGFTNSAILGSAGSRVLAWPHKGMMEFYCALHLTRNGQRGWVQKNVDPAGNRIIRCGDLQLQRGAADPKWEWAWRFALELPVEARGEKGKTLLASLAELFERPPGHLRRPTELMRRAWSLLEAIPEDHLRAFPEQPKLLPGGNLVITRFQRDFQQLLASGDPVARSIRGGFREIPRGIFQMGSPKGEDGRNDDEEPHPVTITRPFLMHEHPVTNLWYERFDPAHNEQRGGYSQDDDQPVIYVSWHDAWIYAKWVCFDEAGSALPTEAQWEYAARAGSERRFCRIADEHAPGGFRDLDADEELKLVAHFNPDLKTVATLPVKRLKPNRFLLYDMLGNVWEWCADWYGEYDVTAGEPIEDPPGPAWGSDRSIRGGGWSSSAGNCRSALRRGDDPSLRRNFLGFRLARSPSGSSGQ